MNRFFKIFVCLFALGLGIAIGLSVPKQRIPALPVVAPISQPGTVDAKASLASTLQPLLPQEKDLVAISTVLKPGMTGSDFNQVLTTIHPNAIWLSDHHEAGTVQEFHTADGKVSLMICLDRCVADPNARVVKWELQRR